MDIQTAQKVAHLSSIALQGQEEAGQRAHELSKILTFVEQLEEVPTTSINPLSSVNDDTQKLRPDEIGDVDTGNSGQERLLKNAPESKFGYYTVPKIVE